MILHFSHMGFTDGLTFILLTSIETSSLYLLLHVILPLVRSYGDICTVTLSPGNVCQNGVPAADIDGEHGIRQCIGNDALKFDYVVFCQDQLTPLVLTLFLAKTGQFFS